VLVNVDVQVLSCDLTGIDWVRQRLLLFVLFSYKVTSVVRISWLR